MIISQLGAFFAGVKAIQYIIVLGTPIQQFDTSTSLLLERFTDQQTINLWWNQRFWNKLLSWDAVYFVKGIINGNPEFEHESAFSPFWSKIVRICCRGNFEFYHVLKTAVILENGLLLLSVFVIYYLTMKTFEENALRSHQRRKLAQKSAMLFILTSATGFFLGIYSEPLSVCLTFLGLLAREVSVSYDVYGNVNCKFMRWPVYTIISTACFAAATTNRPNCVLLGFYYVSDLINLLKTRRFAQASFFHAIRQWSLHVILICSSSVLSSLFTILPPKRRMVLEKDSRFTNELPISLFVCTTPLLECRLHEVLDYQ